ncbi:MAG: UDP-N-acetylglucosamine 2-epimerase (non-hydrolyzing) [Candidatus Daviesbacteria bacterium]|nr:UDP-N-acetylglucosamine 2-epimerase (non-hydrolyzing) [Candidatus Daviesbacteria bacterium]
MKKKIAYILGIRPDVIRSSLILKHLRDQKEFETVFIWSGQHYSDNLKDIFFRELNIKPPEIELNCASDNDSEITGKLIIELSQVFKRIKPDVTVFLGDTNTVLGSIASLQLNIPIVHIEACMRCYNWDMPEERNRTVVDHASDLMYAYLDEYKEQGIREGLNPKNIVVVGNPIVDILQKYFFDRKEKFDKMANLDFFKKRKIEKDKYYVLTCHRRENVENPIVFKSIIKLISDSPYPVFFPASYRTQKVLASMGVKLPNHIIMVDPVGYEELLVLITNSRGVLSDSGTIVEETCILQVPTVNLRISSERPQVYDTGGCVKFDPGNGNAYPSEIIYRKLESLKGKKWKHNFGDGNSSLRIVEDLKKRLLSGELQGHKKENYHISTEHPYREDEIEV